MLYKSLFSHPNLSNNSYIHRLTIRCLGSGALNNVRQSVGLLTEPDPSNIDRDYIGPPDKKSNLRPIVWHIDNSESRIERKLRLRRLEVQQWNQDFWASHNERFYRDREKFVTANKTTDEDSLTSDKMSEFYKQFLDKNWKSHCTYNMIWYLKNAELLLLSLRVAIHSLYRKSN